MKRTLHDVGRQIRRPAGAIVYLVSAAIITGSCGPQREIPAPVSELSFSSPVEKLEILAPLVGARVASATTRGRDPDERGNAGYVQLRERVAGETGIGANRLELWLELLLSHGRQGLVALNDASATEMATQLQGSWDMTGRFVSGQASNVRGRTYNEVLELRDGFARIRSLTVEAGELDLGEPPDAAMGNAFVLGASGMITHEEVRSARFGLAEDEVGVRQVFEGEFISINYPGIPPRGATVRLESLWVKQGRVYRTVFFQQSWDGATDGNRHLLEPADIQITSWGDRYLLGYTNFDSFESYERVSSEVESGSIDAFWSRALEDPRLLDPAVHVGRAAR